MRLQAEGQTRPIEFCFFFRLGKLRIQLRESRPFERNEVVFDKGGLTDRVFVHCFALACVQQRLLSSFIQFVNDRQTKWLQTVNEQCIQEYGQVPGASLSSSKRECRMCEDSFVIWCSRFCVDDLCAVWGSAFGNRYFPNNLRDVASASPLINAAHDELSTGNWR